MKNYLTRLFESVNCNPMRNMRVGRFADNTPENIGGVVSWFKEKRLCGFADDNKQNSNGTNEDKIEIEDNSEEIESTKQLEPPTESITKKIKLNALEIINQTPENILKSPEIISTIFAGEFISDEQKRFLRQKAIEWLGNDFDVSRSLEEQIINYIYDNPNKEQALDVLRPIIMEILKDPHSVLNLCLIHEERIKNYQYYLSLLEGKFGPLSHFPEIDLEKIFNFDKLELGKNRGMTLSQWIEDEETTVEEICEFFGISLEFTMKRQVPIAPSNEIERAIAGVELAHYHVSEADRDPKTGKATKGNIFKRIWNAIEERRKIKNSQCRQESWEKNKEVSESIQESLNKIINENLQLRAVLDAHLKRKAQTTLDSINNRFEGASKSIDSKKPNEIYDHYQTSISAVIHEESDIQNLLTYVLRKNVDEKGQIDPKLNALEITSDDYLSDAESSLGRIEYAEEIINPIHATEFLKRQFQLGAITKEQYERFLTNSTNNEMTTTDEGWMYFILEKERSDHAFAVETLKELSKIWDEAKKNGDEEKLKYLKSILPPDESKTDENIIEVAKRLNSNTATAEDHEYVYERCVDGAPKLKTLLYLSHYGSSLAKFKENVARAEKAGGDRRMNPEATRILLQSVKEKLLPNGSLCPGLKHNICEIFDVKAQLENEFSNIDLMLDNAWKTGDRTIIQEARQRIEILNACYDDINEIYQESESVLSGNSTNGFGRINIKNGSEFSEILKARKDTSKTAACYKGGIIYLNEPKWNQLPINRKKEKMQHEMGHAIIDILTRRTCLFFGMIQGTYNEFKNDNVIDANKTFKELLELRAKDWAIALPPQDLRYYEALTEELMVRYSDWINKGRPSSIRDSADIPLFKHLDSQNNDNNLTVSSIQKDADIIMAAPEDDDDNEEEIENEEDSTADMLDINQMIRTAEETLNNIDDFLEAYPQLKSTIIPGHDKINHAKNVTIEQDFIDIKKFLKNDIKNKIKESRDNLPLVTSNLKILDNRLAKWKEFIAVINEKAMIEIYEAQKKGRDPYNMIRYGDIQLVSIMDIWEMALAIKEDWLRMWKRRGEQVQAKLGKVLTDWIPDQIPYAGRLSNEFNRREQASELAEVQQYRDALKNQDSFSLMDRIGDPTIKNKDEIKAIFEELSERGRLDWNNEDMWKKLKILSGLPFPIKPCINNDILRDKWLQRCISEIWNDKELYYNWRRGNDSGIKSGKDKFTDTVDQLANLSGGLSGELQRQLKLWMDNKDKKDKPDQINPHLYEELLHYAIRDGKMTMEQKFYYLIRGVAEGLLSIDRLRVMAGEGGEILMIFPYIDYFYQKNNSLAHIKTLSKRLTEKDENGKDTYAPGLKTTMFVRLEIAREQAVKERLRKAQSKLGEKIDHDDIPYFLPDLDYSAVNDWYSTAGGSRQKLSPESLKNGYVGYNMKLKTFAALSQINNGNNISSADVKDLVTTITAYIFSDNMLTKNGSDNFGVVRPKLSENEIINTTAVRGMKGTSVNTYRIPLNEFTKEIISLLPDNAWDQINAKVRNKDTKYRVTKDNFTAGNEFEKNLGNEALAKNIYDAIGSFQRELQHYAETEEGRNALINLLQKFSKERFVNDNGLDESVDIETMRKAYEEFRQEE